MLEAQEAHSASDLIPLRHARMAESPFAYYRGTPIVMAYDLANTPRTEIIVQASGDAHISNFGVFGSPRRRAGVRYQRPRRACRRRGNGI